MENKVYMLCNDAFDELKKDEMSAHTVLQPRTCHRWKRRGSCL